MSQYTHKYEFLPSVNEPGIPSPKEAPREVDDEYIESGRDRQVSHGYSTRTLVVASVLSSIATFCGGWLLGSPSLEECGKRLSTHSPALGAITYQAPSSFKATIVQTNRWRGELGHDPRKYDDAWESIGSGVPGLRLYEDDLEKLGKLAVPTPNRTLHKIPDETGGGYPGQLEVFHLLHCLDWLRKGISYNWPYYKDDAHFRDLSPGELEAHNDHCIDVLRMHLMCAADVTPVTYYDTPYRPFPFGDFGTKHTCRDFDAIVKWSKTNPRAIDLDDMGNSTLWKGTSPSDK